MFVRRYWASDPSDHFLEMKRQSCAMVALKSGCVRIGYATRGGACWAISRSEIDAPDHRNQSRRQFDAETGLARFSIRRYWPSDPSDRLWN